MKHLHKNKSFFNLLLARILINAGDSLYYVATTWTVLQWTHHSVLVGLTNTLLMIPMCISFLFGPIVDAIALRKTLIITPILLIFNFINYNFFVFYWHLKCLSFNYFSDTRYVLYANRLSSTIKSNSYFGK